MSAKISDAEVKDLASTMVTLAEAREWILGRIDQSGNTLDVRPLAVWINGQKQDRSTEVEIDEEAGKPTRVVVTSVVANGVLEFDPLPFMKSGELLEIGIPFTPDDIFVCRMKAVGRRIKSDWDTGQVWVRMTFEKLPS